MPLVVFHTRRVREALKAPAKIGVELGFLPGVVLVLVHLFPTRQLGLELACVLMIFTAQVWNMTFSFHGSLRGIPAPLREVTKLHRLSGWQTFRLLEVPAAMIGLVW